MPPLSKSKIIAFRQCAKRLWLEVHRPDLKEDSATTQASYLTGHSVGEIARRIYDPDGRGSLIDIATAGFAGAFKKSASLLQRGSAPIFEAGLRTPDSLAFADIMVPIRSGRTKSWKMVEVKSSTKVKDYHRDDIAVQTFLAREMGLKLSSVAVARVNNSWIYQREGQYRGLLVEEDLTSEALERSREAKEWIKAARATAALPGEPKQQPGTHCYEPFECGFCNYCNRNTRRAEFPVSWFPRLTAIQRAQLEMAGVDDMRNVPGELLTAKQRLVQKHTVGQTTFFDAKAAKASLARAGLPAYFLDFETTNPAVPIWIGSSPYQQLPFQFSLHIVSKTFKLKHAEFLDVSGRDPRRNLSEALIKACGSKGPVFAYNAKFEAGLIRKLAGRFPDLAPALTAIEGRIVDLLPIAESCFYHPSQEGSWSIKKVLPAAVPELSYETLSGVKNGGMAMEAFAEAVRPATTTERREEIRRQLLAYCHMDTLAMVGLWKFFFGLSMPEIS
jgi:hypothetical protein